MNIFENIKYDKVNKLLIDTNKDINSLDKKINKISDYLENNFKSIIFIFIDNFKESILFYYEILKTGNVPVILSPDLDDEAIKNLLKKYKPNYILALNNYKFVMRNYELKKKFNSYYFYKELKKNNHYPHKDLCMLLGTSGSTGNPKFVKLSYENIFSNTKSISKFLAINDDHKVITTLNPNYTYGLSIINTHLFSGAKK